MKVNVWQRGVPVYDAPLVNMQMFFLVLLVGAMLVDRGAADGRRAGGHSRR
jgi:hypothetical protein